jgi:hypothetical protein
MPPRDPGLGGVTRVEPFTTVGDALRRGLARHPALTARLIAYRNSLGNAESKALIADALDALSASRWRESLLVEAAKKHIATSPVFRTKPVGAPGSYARREQDDAIQTEDALREAIRTSEKAHA